MRPIAWSTLLAAVMAAAVASPAYAVAPIAAYAEPSIPDNVPDPGVRPQPGWGTRLPNTPASSLPNLPVNPALPASIGTGPLAMQITMAESDVALLGERLKQLTIERTQVQAQVTQLSAILEKAKTARLEAEAAAEKAIEDAYKHAAKLPPGAVDSDLRGLGVLSRLPDDTPTGTEAHASQLKRAKEAEQIAKEAYDKAVADQRKAASEYTGLQATYRQREQALLKLRQENAAQLSAIERAREAEEQRLGSGYLGDETAAGMRAHPKALQAVAFAKAQLGEDYVLGAEGPNTWDCSGLMWGAYRSVGITLPRVARAQYQGTKNRPVSSSALLPGDLLFFSSPRTDASKIHHVGMYVGGGKMIHAPTPNDVVKISTVWWSHFYGATRVIGAVPAPANPGPTPGPRPTPKPSTKPPTKPPTTKPPTKPPTTKPPTNPTKPPPTPNEPSSPTPGPSPTPTAGAGQPANTPDSPSSSGQQPSVEGSAPKSDNTGTPAGGEG